MNYHRSASLAFRRGWVRNIFACITVRISLLSVNWPVRRSREGAGQTGYILALIDFRGSYFLVRFGNRSSPLATFPNLIYSGSKSSRYWYFHGPIYFASDRPSSVFEYFYCIMNVCAGSCICPTTVSFLVTYYRIW